MTDTTATDATGTPAAEAAAARMPAMRAGGGGVTSAGVLWRALRATATAGESLLSGAIAAGETTPRSLLILEASSIERRTVAGEGESGVTADIEVQVFPASVDLMT